MMKKLLIAIFAGLFFWGVAWKNYNFILSGETGKALIQPPIQTEKKPAGEIIAGATVEQEIVLPDLLFEELVQSKNIDKVCISVFMATYARPNTANYLFYLKQGDIMITSLIESRNVTDNAFNNIFFNLDELKLFKPGKAIIGLKSIDGKSGNAITLWLTKDTKLGIASIKGIHNNNTNTTMDSPGKLKKESRSIIYTLATYSKNRSDFIIRNILVILYAFLAFTIVFIWKSQKPENSNKTLL